MTTAVFLATNVTAAGTATSSALTAASLPDPYRHTVGLSISSGTLAGGSVVAVTHSTSGAPTFSRLGLAQSPSRFVDVYGASGYTGVDPGSVTATYSATTSGPHSYWLGMEWPEVPSVFPTTTVTTSNGSGTAAASPTVAVVPGQRVLAIFSYNNNATESSRTEVGGTWYHAAQPLVTATTNLGRTAVFVLDAATTGDASVTLNLPASYDWGCVAIRFTVPTINAAPNFAYRGRDTKTADEGAST